MVALLGLLAFAFGCNSMQTSSAILRYQQGEFESADSLCGEAIRVNPQDGEAYFYRALSQSMLRNYSAAYENFRKAAELKPDRAVMAQQNIDHNFAEVFNNGVEAANRDESELAIEYFTTATQANPENPQGYTNLAKAYWTKAEKLREYAKEDFKANALLAVENFEIGLGKEGDAVKREETARALAAVLGNLYIESEEDAREPYLTKYREFTKDLGPLFGPHEAFGRVLFDKAEDMRANKRKDELFRDYYTYAGEAYAKAADIRRDLGETDVDVPLFAGIAYLNAEIYAEAANYLNMTVQLDPNLEQAWFYMEFSYYKAGKFDEAIKAALFIDQTLGSTDPQVFQILWQCYRDKAMAADEVGDSAAFQENRRLYEDAYITWATYKGLADVTPTKLLSKDEQAKEEKISKAIFEKGGIAVIDAQVVGRFVKGNLINKGSATVDYIEIAISLKDAGGQTLGDTFTELEGLKPNVQRSFSAAFIQDDVANFAITDIVVE
jgi:tetratricopeptide (TPR) repeat protein